MSDKTLRTASECVSFVSANPVWLEGRENEMNVFAGFRATVDGKAAENAVVRLSAQILVETKGYLLKMADMTGTLWEHDNTSASCCHGFASHVAHQLYRDVLGIRTVDAVKKNVAIAFADVPLQTCEGTMPVGASEVSVRWRKVDKTFFYRVTAPEGFAVKVDTSRLPLKAVRE